MTRRTRRKPSERKTTGPKPTAYEQARARQTGVSVEQLRAEQEAAERTMKLKDEARSVGETD